MKNRQRKKADSLSSEKKVFRKKFVPKEKEILCDVCGRPLVIESYRWNKEEWSKGHEFLLS